MRNSIWDESRVDFGESTREEIADREQRKASTDLAAAQLGLYMIAIGTIIWGYGDLLGPLLKHLP